MTTIAEALRAAREKLQPSETASLEARVLMSHLMGVSHATLLAHGEIVLTDEEEAAYSALVARVAADEPLPYVLGYVHFYDGKILVTPDVLIPRSETELLVEMAIAHAQALPAPVIADVGTGSGPIAVTVARHVPQAHIYASEISAAALAVARRNAEASGVHNITFLEGSIAQPLIDAGVQVDMLLANLPYIESDTIPTLHVSLHEPWLALDGGSDGLDLIRDLLRQVPMVCRPGALILLEIGRTQGAAVLALAGHLPLASADVHRDYAGHERIVRLLLRA